MTSPAPTDAVHARQASERGVPPSAGRGFSATQVSLASSPAHPPNGQKSLPFRGVASSMPHGRHLCLSPPRPASTVSLPDPRTGRCRKVAAVAQNDFERFVCALLAWNLFRKTSSSTN